MNSKEILAKIRELSNEEKKKINYEIKGDNGIYDTLMK